MFLLDTNVISELTKPLPSHEVLNWFAGTPAEQIYISSVTLCEIEFGLALMPASKRRDTLQAATSELLQVDFEDRCVSLDAKCAGIYGQLAAKRQQSGRVCNTEDAMIAAIALRHAFALVTHNTKDFENIAGLKLVDPWFDLP